MTLRLHDTAARAVREFTPLVPGKASVYLCGATVQAPPHIGHIRSGVNFDILVRWLTASGYQVTFCRNVTDIDDKIIKVARGEGVPWWAVAERNQRAFTRAYDALGCLPPDIEPRATGHVPQMIVLMRRLIESGQAYVADGGVYFDVLSYDHYGELSGQRLDHMRPADDIDEGAKRDPRDFALWKAAKPGEPSWETPWGPGRPGWHLECSAMSTWYLGSTFDIHGGGLDLVFPHHENEIAQSHALGHAFAQVWMHNGMLRPVGHAKMSKSEGNIETIRDALDRWGRETLLLFFMTGHWRKPLEYTDETLAAAAVRAEGFREVFRGASVAAPEDAWDRLAAALEDDFNTPEALAVLHEWRDHELLRRGLAVFGLGSLAVAAEAPSDVVELAERRAQARDQREWGEADRLREEIEAGGWEVRDISEAPFFRLVPRP